MADYIMNDDRDAKDILIELRESTGMNRHQFCEYFEIPYMTVSDWEHGKKRVPKYFLRLLEYYVKAEQMNKAKEEQNNGYHSRNGKRVKRNDRRWNDGL